MKYSLFLLGCLALVSCSHQETTTAEAQKKLETSYEDRIGKATKNELVQDFGTPQWCRPEDTGDEMCRFYRKTGTKWGGDSTDRTHYETFDQVVAEFDKAGVLKSFTATSQR